MALKGSSDELQHLVLAAMIQFPNSVGKYHKNMTEKHFSKPEYKVIFTALSDFLTTYQVVPTKEELSVACDKIFKDSYGSKMEIKPDSLEKFYVLQLNSESFANNIVRDFIIRGNTEETLKIILDNVQNNNSIDADMVRSRLINDTSLDYVKSPSMNLADIDSIKPAMIEALGTDDNPIKVKLFIEAVNNCMQYGALTPGTLNLVTAPPGRGKTTFLINQGLYTARNGLTTLHIFLADMTKHDARLRYLSCLSGVPSKDLVKMTDVELAEFTRKWNMSGVLSNIEVASYPAEHLTVTGLIEEILSIQKKRSTHFNQIIIDYDENIAKSGGTEAGAEDNMYKSGGDIYNYLSKFAALNKSVVFIASQPKPSYWSSEIIPLEAASESSKKQKIIDFMLTLGSPAKSITIGTLYIAKNRRGEPDRIFRIKKNGHNARFEHITEEEYQQIKAEEAKEFKCSKNQE